jgi:hypothetical protein
MRQIIATQLFEIIQLNYLLSFNQQQWTRLHQNLNSLHP